MGTEARWTQANSDAWRVARAAVALAALVLGLDLKIVGWAAEEVSGEAGANNAQFVGQDVPTRLQPGERRSVSITLRNTGTSTWTRGGLYKLGTQQPQDNLVWTGATRIYLAPGEAIAPGQSKTFSFEITAPSQPATYDFRWRMVQDEVEWFGAYTPSVAIQVAAPASVNGATFVSQQVPTELQPGERAAATVTMRNSGTTTWSDTQLYKLGTQNPQDNTIWTGATRVYLAPGESVAPGQSKTFGFEITAPSQPGGYDFRWRMVQDDVEWFGAYTPNVRVEVAAPASVNGASFVSQQVPKQLRPGERAAVSVTMRNTGNTTWSYAQQYKLGTQNPPDNFIWTGATRVYLEPGETVVPGALKTFKFDITAPSQEGAEAFQWRMVQDEVEWFGQATPSVDIALARDPHDGPARFVAQNVPTELFVGETARVWITMRNTGTVTWIQEENISLGSQNVQDNVSWGLNRVHLAPGEQVAPGQEKTFRFDIRAPETADEANFQWQMVQDREVGLGWFGDLTPNVSINVRRRPVEGNCPQADPSDNAADDAALQACLDRGGMVVLVPGNPGYRVAQGLVITRDKTVVTSAGAPEKATLFADPELHAPIIYAAGKSGFRLEHLSVDGRKHTRRGAALEVCQLSHRPNASNIVITDNSHDFKVLHSEIKNTLCGTSLQLNGTDFEIAHNDITGNGFSREQRTDLLFPWADGITTGRCWNGHIHDNLVRNSTDIGIVSGGGQYCSVEHNTITQIGVRAFAGLAIHNFDSEANGDHTGASYRFNTITSSYNGMDLGISVGMHPWFKLPTRSGEVSDNTVSGAVINLAVDGYFDGTVRNNALSNPQGQMSHNIDCSFSGNYTAAHADGSDLQPGWVLLSLDQGQRCGTPALSVGGRVVRVDDVERGVEGVAIYGRVGAEPARQLATTDAFGFYTSGELEATGGQQIDVWPQREAFGFAPLMATWRHAPGDQSKLVDFQAEPPQTVVWESDAFDQLQAGALHGQGGWWMTATNGASAVVRAVSAGKYLQIDPAGGATVLMDKDVADQVDGRHDLNLRVRVWGASEASLAKIEVRTVPASGWDKKLQLYFGSSIRVNYSASGAAVTLVPAVAPGHWYRIRLELDLPGGRFAAWVDNQLVAADVIMHPGPIVSLGLSGWDRAGSVDLDDLLGVRYTDTPRVDPRTVDSDQDGVSDADEEALYRTDPRRADSDGDGMNDGAEIAAGRNPTVNEPKMLVPLIEFMID